MFQASSISHWRLEYESLTRLKKKKKVNYQCLLRWKTSETVKKGRNSRPILQYWDKHKRWTSSFKEQYFRKLKAHKIWIERRILIPPATVCGQIYSECMRGLACKLSIWIFILSRQLYLWLFYYVIIKQYLKIAPINDNREFQDMFSWQKYIACSLEILVQ